MEGMVAFFESIAIRPPFSLAVVLLKTLSRMLIFPMPVNQNAPPKAAFALETVLFEILMNVLFAPAYISALINPPVPLLLLSD